MAKTFKKIILDDLKVLNRQDIIKKITSIVADHSSVKVRTKNLFKTQRDWFDAYLHKYEMGHFDGMTDCYEYNNRRDDVERQVRFVFLDNDFCEELKKEMKENLVEKWGITDDQTAMKARGRWYDQCIYCDLLDLEG